MLQKCCPHSALGMWERYLKAIRPRRTWQLRVVLPRLSLQQPKSWFFYQGERNEAFLEKWPMNAFSSSGGWSKHWSLCLALGAPAEGGSRQLCSSGCMPVALVSKFLFGAAPFFVCVRFFSPLLLYLQWFHNCTVLLSVSFSENAPMLSPDTSRVYFGTPSLSGLFQHK